MGYRLLLDENVEREVYSRLTAGGHDVQHVDDVPSLEKGASDETLAAYSLETDRTIVTYDDDFVDEVPSDTFRAVLFFENDAMPARSVARIVDAMADAYPHEAVDGVQKAGKEWL